MTLTIAGIVREYCGDHCLVDEANRRYIIPSEELDNFPLDHEACAEIVIPLRASLSYNGRVIRRSTVDPREAQDNHLLEPPHPDVARAWRQELEEDRRILETPIHLYRVTIESRTKMGTRSVVQYEVRSVRAGRAVLKAYRYVFPTDRILRAICSLVAIDGLPVQDLNFIDFLME